MAHRGPIRELPAQLLWNQQLQIPRPQLLYHLHFQNKGLKVPLESAVTRNRGGGVPLEFKFARPPVVWRATRHWSYAFPRLGSVGPRPRPQATGHLPPSLSESSVCTLPTFLEFATAVFSITSKLRPEKRG